MSEDTKCVGQNATGVRAELRGRGWFDNPDPTFVAGPIASGTTNMAFVLGDCVRQEGWSVASNIPSCQEADFAGTACDVLKWARQTSGPKLFIFDELPSILQAHPRRWRVVIGKLFTTLSEEGVKPVFVVDDVPEWAELWDATCIRMQDRTTAEIADNHAGTVECGSIPVTTMTYDQCEVATWGAN